MYIKGVFGMKRKEHKTINGVEMKECSRCKELLPLSEFRKDGSKWDGLYGFCKKCAKEKDRKSYEKDREGKCKKVLEYKIRTGTRYNPQYYKSEKAKRKKMVRDAKRRKSIRNANKKSRITKEIIEKVLEIYSGKCAYCGCECYDGHHIDHKIPLSKGGGNEIENLALSCPNCNWSKRDKTDIEFIGRKV